MKLMCVYASVYGATKQCTIEQTTDNVDDKLLHFILLQSVRLVSSTWTSIACKRMMRSILEWFFRYVFSLREFFFWDFLLWKSYFNFEYFLCSWFSVSQFFLCMWDSKGPERSHLRFCLLNRNITNVFVSFLWSSYVLRFTTKKKPSMFLFWIFYFRICSNFARFPKRSKIFYWTQRPKRKSRFTRIKEHCDR